MCSSAARTSKSVRYYRMMCRGQIPLYLYLYHWSMDPKAGEDSSHKWGQFWQKERGTEILIPHGSNGNSFILRECDIYHSLPWPTTIRAANFQVRVFRLSNNALFKGQTASRIRSTICFLLLQTSGLGKGKWKN